MAGCEQMHTLDTNYQLFLGYTLTRHTFPAATPYPFWGADVTLQTTCFGFFVTQGPGHGSSGCTFAPLASFGLWRTSMFCSGYSILLGAGLQTHQREATFPWQVPSPFETVQLTDFVSCGQVQQLSRVDRLKED